MTRMMRSPPWGLYVLIVIGVSVLGTADLASCACPQDPSIGFTGWMSVPQNKGDLTNKACLWNLSLSNAMYWKFDQRAFLHANVTNLQSLYMIHNSGSLPTLAREAFYGLDRLKSLSLIDFYVAQYTSGWTQGLTALQELTMARTYYSAIDWASERLVINSRLLMQTRNLRSLTLDTTGTNSIADNSFSNNAKLAHIKCVNNMLTSITSGTFQGARALTHLDLQNNQITTVDRFAFQGLKLVHLNLQNNQITAIDSNAFKGLNLVYLNLANNLNLLGSSTALSLTMDDGFELYVPAAPELIFESSFKGRGCYNYHVTSKYRSFITKCITTIDCRFNNGAICRDSSNIVTNSRSVGRRWEYAYFTKSISTWTFKDASVVCQNNGFQLPSHRLKEGQLKALSVNTSQSGLSFWLIDHTANTVDGRILTDSSDSSLTGPLVCAWDNQWNAGRYYTCGNLGTLIFSVQVYPKTYNESVSQCDRWNTGLVFPHQLQCLAAFLHHMKINEPAVHEAFQGGVWLRDGTWFKDYPGTQPKRQLRPVQHLQTGMVCAYRNTSCPGGIVKSTSRGKECVCRMPGQVYNFTAKQCQAMPRFQCPDRQIVVETLGLEPMSRNTYIQQCTPTVYQDERIPCIRYYLTWLAVNFGQLYDRVHGTGWSYSQEEGLQQIASLESSPMAGNMALGTCFRKSDTIPAGSVAFLARESKLKAFYCDPGFFDSLTQTCRTSPSKRCNSEWVVYMPVNASNPRIPVTSYLEAAAICGKWSIHAAPTTRVARPAFQGCSSQLMKDAFNLGYKMATFTAWMQDARPYLAATISIRPDEAGTQSKDGAAVVICERTH